jgi:2-dehydropantoate 2-reductase
MRVNMRTLIVGAGVNGVLVGAALVEAGADVTMLTRAERHKQLLMASTKITSPLGRFSAPMQAVTPQDLNGPFDVVMLATRANLYQPALFVIRDAIAPETLIVPAFDGVHHLDHWRECYRDNPVAIARFDVRAMQDADGIVRQQGSKGDLKLGLVSQHGAEKLEALCTALDGRRFRAYPDGETVLTDVWARAIYRAAAAGACQLSGTTLRDTVRFESSAVFKAMVAEGIRVGEARGLWKLLHAANRYRTAFLREGEPVSAPAPIAASGRAGSEALFLLANALRQAQDAGVSAPTLQRAWQATASKAPAFDEVA